MGAIEAIVALVLAGSWIAALVVSGMKARWVLLVLGVLFGLPAYIGALLPARPGSAWANRGR